MNRTIKFRGKRIDNNEWIYGHYSTSIEKGDNGGIECNYRETSVELHYINNILVYPETLGQYTGLNDGKRTKEYPNGQEVYEDDAMAYYGNPYYGIIIIEWDNNRQRYNNWGSTYEPNNKWCEQHQIIGNIHDNVEFLEYK